MARVKEEDRPVVLYDGTCRLCQRFVRFARARDPRGRIRFLPADTPEGARSLRSVGEERPAGCLHSVLLIEGETTYERSTATLRVLRRLRAPWSWLSVLRALPRPWRDRVYDYVAARRFAWFGRDEAAGEGDDDTSGGVCLVPEHERT